MYDMYRWNESEQDVDAARRHASAKSTSSDSAHRGRRRRRALGQSSHRTRPDRHEPAAKAVQSALDRRDNGGDASGSRGQ